MYTRLTRRIKDFTITCNRSTTYYPNLIILLHDSRFLVKMFESIANEYLQHTAYKNWSVISILEYIKSKSDLSADMFGTLKADIYSVLRNFSDHHNIRLHQNAKKKAIKLLSNFNDSWSSTKVRLFIEGLKLNDKEAEYRTTMRRKIASSNALQALEVSLKQ